MTTPTRSVISELHDHWHEHHGPSRRRLSRIARRGLRGPRGARGALRSPGEELAALEAYRRDVEEHLADVSAQIRRLEDAHPRTP